MFYMKSIGGNVYRRVKSDAKRQELLAAGWTDAHAPIEATAGNEPDAPQPKEIPEGEPEKEPEQDNADAPIEAKNTYQRRVNGKGKGKTVTV